MPDIPTDCDCTETGLCPDHLDQRIPALLDAAITTAEQAWGAARTLAQHAWDATRANNDRDAWNRWLKVNELVTATSAAYDQLTRARDKYTANAEENTA